MQLQLSLALADRLHETLLVRGEPIDALEAASLITASKSCPPILCREIVGTLVYQDRRFCWVPETAESAENLGERYDGQGTDGGGQRGGSVEPEGLMPRISLRHWEPYDPDLSEVPFVSLDLETTGSRPGPGKITEIGMVRFENFREVCRMSSLVNPMRPIPRMITAITGITQEMVATAPRIDELMPDILSFLEGAVVVAHNAAFDVGFLNYELRRLKGRRLGDGAIDTLTLSRALAPGLPNYRLGTVAEALGSPVSACHRALADAEAAGHVFITLMNRLREQGVSRLSQAQNYTVSSARATEKLTLTRDLPVTPGAYTFVDDLGRVVFVGKAESLREEVRSHFVGPRPPTRKLRQASRLVERIDWEETCTSLEAAVREQELIIEHRPQCNQHSARPESYVYIKMRDAGPGLCLYASNRPLRSSDKTGNGSKRGRSVLALGPFKKRARVTGALDLLQNCYRIRRCARQPQEGPCARGAAGECLAPCRRDDGVLLQHDRIVRGLVDWLTGRPTEIDPIDQAEALISELTRQNRSEEAQAARRALDDLSGLRRSYAALAEASALRFVALSTAGINGDGPSVRLNIVWDGHLLEPVSATVANLNAAIGHALATCGLPQDSPGPTSGVIAVPAHDVDSLLAVRRWLKEAKRPVTVPLSATDPGSASLDVWKSELLATAVALLEETTG